MPIGFKAIETEGSIDAQHRLHLDAPLPVAGPGRVRVLILIPEPVDEEPDERQWLQAAARNPAFDFLYEAEEDVYSLSDGKPFHDQG
jgi:hypothetical protein